MRRSEDVPSSRTTMEQIREKYPNPVRAAQGHKDGLYCVGGAICHTVYEIEGNAFPDEETLGDALALLNPYLVSRPEEASEFAIEIIEHNDRGDFEAAWWWLDRAINYAK